MELSFTATSGVLVRLGSALERGFGEALLNSCALSFLLAWAMPVCSLIFAIVLRYYVASRAHLWWALALSFFPFALGPAVFAYITKIAIDGSDLAASVSALDDPGKVVATGIFLALRILPLGIFFFLIDSSSLPKVRAEYARVNGLSMSSHLRHAVSGVSTGTVIGFGVFAGAVGSAEVAIPKYLFRANPGTGGETIGLLLSRLYAQFYSEGPRDAAIRVGAVGIAFGAITMFAALMGAVSSAVTVRIINSLLASAIKIWVGRAALSSSAIAGVSMLVLYTVSGFAVVSKGAAVASERGTWAPSLPAGGVAYALILALATALAIMVGAVTVAILGRLRLGVAGNASSSRQLLYAACLFMPLFVPARVYSLAAQHAAVSENAARFGPLVLALGFIGINGPVMLHIFSSIFAALPTTWLEWERANGMRLSFTIWVDGFVQFRAAVAGLGVMCVAFVLTDGSLAPAFSNVVPSFEQTLSSAVFGRAGDSGVAVALAASTCLLSGIAASAVATLCCRELGGEGSA